MFTIKTQLQGHNIISGVNGSEARVSESTQEQQLPQCKLITAKNIIGTVYSGDNVVGAVLDCDSCVRIYKDNNIPCHLNSLAMMVDFYMASGSDSKIYDLIYDCFPSNHEFFSLVMQILRDRDSLSVAFPSGMMMNPWDFYFSKPLNDLIFAPEYFFKNLYPNFRISSDTNLWDLDLKVLSLIDFYVDGDAFERFFQLMAESVDTSRTFNFLHDSYDKVNESSEQTTDITETITD